MPDKRQMPDNCVDCFHLAWNCISIHLKIMSQLSALLLMLHPLILSLRFLRHSIRVPLLYESQAVTSSTYSVHQETKTSIHHDIFSPSNSVTLHFNKSINVSADTKKWMTLNSMRTRFFIRLGLKRFCCRGASDKQ